MNLSSRLLAGALVVIGALVAFMNVVVDRQFGRQLAAEKVEALAGEARLVARELTPGLSPAALARRAGATTGHRVTLIDSAGKVIGDSQFEEPALSGLENHAGRPEVVQARAEGIGMALRQSASAGDEELYVAVQAPFGFARVSLRTAVLNAIVSGARRDVAVAGLLAMLGAAILAWLFANAVSGPVRELRDVTKALADGDFTRRPALAAPGEVGDLADAVHRLAEQLGTRLEALRSEETLLQQLAESLNEGIIAVDTREQVVRINDTARTLLGLRAPLPFPAEILPRDRTLRDALAAALAGETVRDVEAVVAGRTITVTARPLERGGAVVAILDLTRLRRLETVRRDFVANVSHELKTPLTVVRGFAETLAEDDPEPDTRRRFAQSIVGNTRRMQRIVDDLLDLSRIESGGWLPDPRAVDLAVVAGDSLAAARPAADVKGIALRTEIAPNANEVFADQTALRQVLGNLVDNAVRHTDSGSVTVISTARHDGVTIAVRDTGRGIHEEHLPRIFERFYRVDPARSREEGGTGLGLAIVKHLVEAHGGRVRAESVPGRGTTVFAEFPVAPGR